MKCRAILACVLVCQPIVLAEPPPAHVDARPLNTELLTLHVKGQPADGAFAALGKATGCRIRGRTPNFWDNAKDAPVLSDFDRQPFWAIVRELCREAGARPVMSYRHELVLAQDPKSVWIEQPFLVSGPVRVAVVDAGPNRDVSGIRAVNVPEQLSLHFELLCDPRVEALYATPLEIESFEGEDGKPIPTLRSFKIKARFSEGPGQLRIWIDPSMRGRQIRLLKASTEVVAAARWERLEVPDVMAANAVVKDAGGLKLAFTVQPRPGGAHIQVKTENPNIDPDRWDELTGGLSSVQPRLLDKQGRAFNVPGGGGGVGPRQFSQQWDFASPPKGPALAPDKFVWDVPVEFKVIPVTIEFKDLRVQ